MIEKWTWVFKVKLWLPDFFILFILDFSDKNHILLTLPPVQAFVKENNFRSQRVVILFLKEVNEDAGLSELVTKRTDLRHS